MLKKVIFTFIRNQSKVNKVEKECEEILKSCEQLEKNALEATKEFSSIESLIREDFKNVTSVLPEYSKEDFFKEIKAIAQNYNDLFSRFDVTANIETDHTVLMGILSAISSYSYPKMTDVRSAFNIPINKFNPGHNIGKKFTDCLSRIHDIRTNNFANISSIETNFSLVKISIEKP
jgi:hypothetical protein